MRFSFLSAMHSSSPRIGALTALFASVSSLALAQFGASPSQTGAFFDDFRGRAGSRVEQHNAQRTEGTYDFSSDGSYEGSENAEPVTQDAARQVSQGYNGNGNLVYSQRQAGDYTQYSGPYPAANSFFAPAYTSDPFLGGRRNLKVGPVNLAFGLTGLVEYNDNVNRSGTNPISDVITSSYLNISANYAMTRDTNLTLSTAIGFDRYMDHPELSPYGNDLVLNILPGTTIAVDAMIGPVYVMVYDRMSVRPAAQNDFALNDRSIFGVFQNDLGFAANWAMNSQTNVSLNYMHSDAMTLDSTNPNVDFSIYDRTTDSLQGSIAWSPNGVWTLGMEGGTTFVSYPQNFNNDGQLSNVGAYFTTPLGKMTSMRVGAGVQSFDFEAPRSANSSGDTSGLSDLYYNVTLSNRLTSRISHAINFGHESALNTISNYITADYVSYGVGIIAGRGGRLSLSTYYENAGDSGGTLAEAIDQYGFDVYYTHQLTSRVRMGVGYHHGQANSSLVNRSYVQDSFSIDFGYALTRKLGLSLGYRHYVTDAENDALDFVQNRVVLSANYNF
jgi:hypothetical protein